MEELQELLGLDIPPIPEVSLAGITSDSVLLYWKPPDNQAASLKHTIEVNGIKGTRSLRTRQFFYSDTNVRLSKLANSVEGTLPSKSRV